MERWIRENFAIIEGGWENLDGTTEDAFEFENGNRMIIAPVRWFAEKCADVNVPPTITHLNSIFPDDARWKEHFQAWAKQGKLAQ